jgi:uncharacterized iron-regulated membrane protein
MRTYHRLCAIIAVLVLLYLGITGSLIQLFDLTALLKNTPESAPVMQSIREGMYGQNNYQVLVPGDFNAATLPPDLGYEQSVTRVLEALHQQSPGAEPRFVELRVVNGRTVGQVKVDKEIWAFDAQTGASVPATDIRPSRPPPSPRQFLKEIHRFWKRQDVPGVYVELLCGIAFWMLIISGLTLYYQLLRARRKIKRPQLFWSAGGWWRSGHRAISLAAAVFLMAVAFSGTWLGMESTVHTFLAKGPVPEQSAPLSDRDVVQMTAATLAAFRQTEPQTPIKVLRVRVFAQMKQGVIVTDGPETRQLVYNTDTGKTMSLTEPGYPNGGFPFGVQMHENMKHFHSGQMLGLTARWMDLFAGLSLIYLAVSGLTVYFQLWSKRRSAGRGRFVWL